MADLGRGRGGGAVKRALVTGGHGFVASHLARALLERGDSVTVLDLAPPPLSGLTLQGVGPEIELIEADLRDAQRVGAALDAGEFDVVFHLAAQTLVGPAMADPLATFEVNVVGTWNLLEACRHADVPAIVVASSDKAYGPSAELPYREDMPLRPASPYEASKAAADSIALSYHPAYGLPVAVTRFANIYGGGDLNFSRLIPETVAAVLDGRRPLIRSDGSPERDFLYVDDAVAAYLAIEHAVGAGGPAAGEPFNAGGERPHSVAEVLETIAAVSGAGLEPEYKGTGNPPGEIDRQYVDSAKLRALTGWSPAVELSDGLGRTLEWYRQHPEARP
jgi:CDP-glucose 4,6-dehydratase